MDVSAREALRKVQSGAFFYPGTIPYDARPPLRRKKLGEGGGGGWSKVYLLLATPDETSLNLYFKTVYLEQMILLKTLELSSQHICIFKFLSK